MSPSTPGHVSSSSNFISTLDVVMYQALNEYKQKTGEELLDHPLAIELHDVTLSTPSKPYFKAKPRRFSSLGMAIIS
jgi:hypothetical protein